MSHILLIGSEGIASHTRQSVTAYEIAQQIRQVMRDQSNMITRIRICGLDIGGEIDLSGMDASSTQLPAMAFDNCAIGTLNVHESVCGRVTITNSSILSFQAAGATIRAGLNFEHVRFGDDEGSNTPSVSLYQARIEGDVYWSDVHFTSDQPLAMALSEIQVSGRLLILNSSIHARFLLEGAQLGSFLVSDTTISGVIKALKLSTKGHVSFTRSTIGNGSESLIGEGCEFGAAVMFAASHLKGKLRLYSSRIGINLEIKQGTLCDPDETDTCMDLSSTTFGNAILVSDRSSLQGTIHLHQAIVHGQVELANSFFLVNDSRHPSLCFGSSRMGGLSISACAFKSDLRLNNITTSGDVFLGDMAQRFDADEPARREARLRAEVVRRIDLSSARIGGKLTIADSVPAPQLAPNSQTDIVGTTKLHAVAHIHLVLDGTGVDAIELPRPNPASVVHISWIGFTTNRLRVTSPDEATQIVSRLNQDAKYWFERRRQLQIQPFIHFAHVLRQAGWHDQADDLLVSMRRVERRAMGDVGKLWALIFDTLFLFGFGKMRSAITLALWIAFGTIGTSLAVKSDALVLSTEAVLPAVSVTQPGGDAAPAPLMIYGKPPTFSDFPCHGEIVPVYYAIELVLPIFELGQREKCDLHGLQKSKFWLVDSIFWWWLAKYFYVVTGWIIVSMTLLTFLGTLKTRAYGSL
jgi:hypothetical protein